MLQRCGARLPQKWPLPNSFSRIPSRYNATRTASSTSESSRILPGTQQPFYRRAAPRRFVIGCVTGFVLVQAWYYYDNQRVRNSFTTYKLVDRQSVSSTASIFHLQPKDPSGSLEDYTEAWKQGIWNVHFKQPQIQIIRAYTPLPPSQDGKNTQDLRFLIRHDPHGEVSSYLHRLPVGSDIELRGPNVEYQLTPDVRQIVFFAGGTGIAPALQVAHAMFEGNKQKEASSGSAIEDRKLHILWASRKREDCLGGVSDAPVDAPMPPKPTWSGLFTKPKAPVVVSVGEEKGLIVRELEELKQKYPGQVTVEYFVNTEGTWIDDDVVFRTLSRFDDKDFSKGAPSEHEQRQILISGPNGFITYLAGPKEWRNGREEQGGVSKIIAHAIARNPHHVKVWKV